MTLKVPAAGETHSKSRSMWKQPFLTALPPPPLQPHHPLTEPENPAETLLQTHRLIVDKWRLTAERSALMATTDVPLKVCQNSECHDVWRLTHKKKDSEVYFQVNETQSREKAETRGAQRFSDFYISTSTAAVSHDVMMQQEDEEQKNMYCISFSVPGNTVSIYYLDNIIGTSHRHTCGVGGETIGISSTFYCRFISFTSSSFYRWTIETCGTVNDGERRPIFRLFWL